MQVYGKLYGRAKKINQTFNPLSLLSHSLIIYPVTHTLNFTGHCKGQCRQNLGSFS